MVKANFVNHTHWDREWYFTTMDALVLSEQLFTEVLDELEKNKDANFCLDGQISIVDEYVEIHPEAKKRIQKLVGEGRLFVGPWYTQTDALIPDTESIIRNLVIGIKDTEHNYGKPMMIGYLPDTFGFNAQMPTLLHQVGINSFLFWRGTNFDRQMNSLYFRWKGLSEKEVLAANFPFGYFTAQIDLESKKNLKEFVDKRYDPGVKFAIDHGKNNEVLMPSGIDQMNIIKNIHDTVKELNKYSDYSTEISTYPEFIKKMEQENNLPEYSGELRLPTYARVHRTIGSVRHRIKMENFYLEQKILRRIEPLVVIAKNNGVEIGNGLLIKLWKKLLECQPHDTLGGSVSDNVAVDIMHRFKEANEIADGIENTIEKKMSEFLNLSDHDVLIFNTDPYPYKGDKVVSVVASSKNIKFDGLNDEVLIKSKKFPVRHHILMMTPRGREFTDEPEYYQLTFKGNVELPAFGYKVIHFKETNIISELVKSNKSSQHVELSNGKMKVIFDNGHLNIQTLTGKINDFLQIVESGNDGDTYDYSPLKGDEEKVIPYKNAYAESVEGKNKVLVVNGSASLPATLEDRLSNDPKYRTMSFILKLSFNQDGLLETKLSIDNTVQSHRIRLQLSPDITTETAIAQIQNGFIKTTNKPISENWNQEFVEKPVNIYNFDKSVSITDKDNSFTFFGKGMKEYQFDSGKLFITLMSTTGELGKANLAWRPGRASGDTTNQGHIMMPTPLAEELGLNEFEFAIDYSSEPFSESTIGHLTYKWLSQSISYQKQQLNLFIHRLDNKIWDTDDNPTIPMKYSMMDIGNEYIVSAIYASYDDSDSYIVRLSNPTSKKISIDLHQFKDGQIVDALENPIENHEFIDPYDLTSIKCKY
ncbi:glycosyl hydrolase family 38 protein [Companilactobacillus farciminis]|jgi:alpha-mannosidase|nr:glycosyl hydrolase family 38 protein [Companilactobacillus farciminis]